MLPTWVNSWRLGDACGVFICKVSKHWFMQLLVSYMAPSHNLNQFIRLKISILRYHISKMHWEMSSAKWWPFYLGLGVSWREKISSHPNAWVYTQPLVPISDLSFVFFTGILLRTWSWQVLGIPLFFGCIRKTVNSLCPYIEDTICRPRTFSPLV